MHHDSVTGRTKPIPVLVDNGLNRAFAIKYIVYALFGFTGIFTHIPSVEELTGAVVAQIIAGAVFLSSALAALGAWKYQRGIRWVKTELYSTYFMISFVLVYNVALVVLTLNGDTDRLNLAVLATALLVMPIWRVRELIRRAKR